MKKWFIMVGCVLITALCIGCASSSINVVTLTSKNYETKTKSTTPVNTRSTQPTTKNNDNNKENNKSNSKVVYVRVDGSTEKKEIKTTDPEEKETNPIEETTTPPTEPPTTEPPTTEPQTTAQPETTQPQVVETTAPQVQATPVVKKRTWHARVVKSVKVVDQPAYTYQEPVYVEEVRQYCNRCGADITDNVNAHLLWEQQQFAFFGGYYCQTMQIQRGFQTICVPEKCHYEDRVVREAGYY